MNNHRYDLRPLQDCILNAFKSFADVCKRHNLRYYAIYGTALGAIRHKGFIPWDDDLDVAMPRPDYNKFMEIAAKELPQRYGFRSGGDDILSPIWYARVVDEQSDVVSELISKTNLDLQYPPFVDIFPLDAIESDSLFQMSRIMIRFKRSPWLRYVQMFRHHESMGCLTRRNELEKLFAQLLGMILSPLVPSTGSNQEFIQLWNRIIEHKNPYMTAKKVVEYNFFHGMKERIISVEDLEPARIVPFEDTEIRVASNVEKILLGYYGNYMQYPKEEDRVPKHQLRRARRNPT